MKNPVYLGLSILELSNYMDTDSFMVYVKKMLKLLFTLQILNWIDQSMPKGISKKVIGLIKDKLGWKIMTKFVGWTEKSYLIDDDSEDKESKG